MITTKTTCPLGHVCEEIKNNEIHRCAWYTQVAGQLPDGTDTNESKCAMAWMPILMIENAMTNRGQTAALESFRNEVVTASNTTNNILANAAASSMRQIQHD